MRRWLAVFAALALSSCTVKHLPSELGNPKWGLDITWHGHSCFTLADSIGREVVIDPYDETVGYGMLSLRADALLITHDHFDHDNRRAVKARLSDIDIVDASTGTWTVASGLVVTGIASSHDPEGGQINGPNTMFLFQMGGLRCLHMGDVGDPHLSDYQKNLIGRVDVLFIPVGGVTTVGPKQAKALVDELKPGAVFPMHHGDIRFYRLEGVEKFASLFPPQNVWRGGNSVRVRPTDLTDTPIVYILTPQTRD